MTAQNVISVPTERSMPAVMMTNVQAIARTPLTAVDCKMPRILSVCMNAGEAKVKKISRMIRLANASSFWRADELKNRARNISRRPPFVIAAVLDRVAICVISSGLRRPSMFRVASPAA